MAPGERISEWLELLGLAKYAAVFDAHRITLPVAARLSEVDLAHLGITLEEDRRRLLRASAELLASTGTTEPERRHITVMFCDLIGSTTISTRLDPEDLAALILRYQKCCADAVARFDGFIARYVGDGVLAYFGYPQAQEDDSERAIRAGLLVVSEIDQLDMLPSNKLQVRIGIATGPAVVGNSVLELHAAVGETPNLAARLQTTAGPNEVIIAQTTYRLAGAKFDCVQLDSLTLKGVERPVQAWRVKGDRQEFDRFQLRRAAGLTDYVGRESEIGALVSRWRKALAGMGHTILVVGEAGIGKSRLVEELARQIGKESCFRIYYFGSPFFSNTPLFPVIAQMERAAHVLPNDAPDRRRQKIDSFVKNTWREAPAEAAAVVAAAMSLPPDQGDPPPEPDPAQRKEKTFRILEDQIAAQADGRPILIVGEDLHWFDPTTIEFLGRLIGRCQVQSSLIALTFRPEFKAPWRVAENVAVLALRGLDRCASAVLVGRVARDQKLAHPLLEKIVERCDGVPLFIEELTKAVLDEPVRDATVIPETLHDSLVARIDRLHAAKEVIQIGAAIGREFQEDLLQAVACMEPGELNSRLELLVSGNLLDRYTSYSGTTYAYKHALIQDAAYGTMLFARRRQIHRRIATVLERRFQSQWQAQPELIAYHWERAGDIKTALCFWKLAGTQAAERSAATEAAAHLRHALAILNQVPPGHDRDVLEIELNAQLGAVLRAVQGPAGLDTGVAFSRAKDLCRRTGETTLLAPALAGLYGYQLVRAEHEAAGESARELLALAEARHDRVYQMIGHRAVGAVQVHTGNFLEARRHLECSLSLYDPPHDGPLAFVYGTDHAQTASSFLSFALHLMGLREQAHRREEWALQHGEGVGHLYSRVQTLAFRTMMRLLAREWEVAAAMAEEALVLTSQRSFALMKAALLFFASASRAVLEPSLASAAALHKAAGDWWSTGAMNYRAHHLALIAEVYAAAGDLPHAFELLSQGLRHVAETNERWIEAEVHRLRGEFKLMLARPEAEEAERSFTTAIDVARKQSAMMWELRARTSLANSLVKRGKADEARTQLAPVLAIIAEGFPEHDIRRARMVLQRTRSGTY
jgi:class 3 adenylate cyclase/predicted ATPase